MEAETEENGEEHNDEEKIVDTQETAAGGLVDNKEVSPKEEQQQEAAADDKPLDESGLVGDAADSVGNGDANDGKEEQDFKKGAKKNKKIKKSTTVIIARTHPGEPNTSFIVQGEKVKCNKSLGKTECITYLFPRHPRISHQ
jgi:hypothetical protein